MKPPRGLSLSTAVGVPQQKVLPVHGGRTKIEDIRAGLLAAIYFKHGKLI